MRRLATIAAAAIVAAGACAPSAPMPPARTPGPNEYALPTDPNLTLRPSATPLVCAGIGLDAVLAGSASDPRKVWLQDAQSGGRIDLVWPMDFTVRFGQGAAFDVLNASGKVAIVGGSHVSGACVGKNAYWLDNVAE